jgi:hypothetical protein
VIASDGLFVYWFGVRFRVFNILLKDI